MKQPAIVILALGLIAGVGIASWLPGYLMWLGIGLGGCAVLIWRRAHWIAVLAAAAGAGLIWQQPLHVPTGDIAELAGKRVAAEGTVDGYPEQRGDRQMAVVKAVTSEKQGKILVSAEPHPELMPGDRVRVVGRVQAPAVFPDFDYRTYLAARGIHSVMYHAHSEVIGADPSARRLLGQVKRVFAERLTQLFPEPVGAFLLGILLGERAALPDSVADAFRRTGLSHVLALSGYNISILVAAGVAICGRGSWAIFAILTTIFLFVLMVGPTASVVRAAAMGGLILVANMLGRPQLALDLCIVTGAVMLIANPWALRYDLGFVLSFAATLGILILEPGIKSRLSGPGWPRQILAATAAATLATLPIVAANFGTVSLVSPVANLLVVPLIPALMLGAFVTTAGSFIWWPLAAGAALLVGGLAGLLLDGIETLASWRWAAVAAPATRWTGLITAAACGVLAWKVRNVRP